MKFPYWGEIIAGLSAFFVAYVGKGIDFKGLIKKTEIENQDEIYSSWKQMYETKSADHKELKEEYDALRKNVFQLQESFGLLKLEMHELKSSMEEREQGYLIQIEKLESRVEELEEENAILKESLESFKGGE